MMLRHGRTDGTKINEAIKLISLPCYNISILFVAVIKLENYYYYFVQPPLLSPLFRARISGRT